MFIYRYITFISDYIGGYFIVKRAKANIHEILDYIILKLIY